MLVIEAIPTSVGYPRLKGKVDDNILHLQDARGMFLLDKVTERILKYFINNCVDKPWCNHILFALFVETDRNLNPQSILNTFTSILTRMSELFRVYSLHEMNEFDVDVHIYPYLKGEIFPEHSNSKRTEFLKRYKALSYITMKWYTQKLNSDQQAYFEKYLLPIPSFDSRDFSFTKLALDQAQSNRKEETDAILPHLPEIRAMARFRWNQMKRLREAFLKAVKEAQNRPESLPLDFNYDEPERIGEGFYFRLWDKPSFVLHHQELFSETVVQFAINRKGTYSDENNHFFVEFLKAERLHDEEAVEGLWFAELIKKGVIGGWRQNATKEETQQIISFLASWGYGGTVSLASSVPFDSQHKGIIIPSTFVSKNKNKAEGVLIDVEPFYVSCTFGLLAVDIFTTTGARLNELLQLNNTKECIQVKKIKDQLHYSFRAIPKGRDEVEDFYISKQTMEYVQIVLRMLKDHYLSDKIPSVVYEHHRKYQFPTPKPYFFQYHKKALNNHAISSNIRFLLHGLRYETQEGNPVTVKPHLLRHAFATEAVQRQKMPIDVVAKILHQRDLSVTGYYSAPTPTQVSQAVGELHDLISSYIDVDEVLLRSPAELQKELEEHNKKVGVFNKVLGGTCVTDFVCPTKMECLGCKAKIPQPEQENELHEVIELSVDMEKRFTKIGLDVEVRKAKEMRKQARIELKEIEMIKQYREEQKYEPTIHINT